MTVTITDKKIALIAANGFDENHMTVLQRTLTQAKQTYKVIAPEQGLVNGWQNNAWGHYFTVDAPLNTAMGSDYDALILVGGERSIAKLMQNPHTKRIINHFIDAEKPVAAIADGVLLLTLGANCPNKTVAACPAIKAEVIAAKMIEGTASLEHDGNILTSTGEDIQTWAQSVVETIAAYTPPQEEEEAVAA